MEKPVKEVVYENNPYLVQQLENLRESESRCLIHRCHDASTQTL